MNRGKSKEFYGEGARRLREKFPPRSLITVRDVMDSEGYTSTSPALNFLLNMVKWGFVLRENNGKYSNYYLVNE